MSVCGIPIAFVISSTSHTSHMASPLSYNSPHQQGYHTVGCSHLRKRYRSYRRVFQDGVCMRTFKFQASNLYNFSHI